MIPDIRGPWLTSCAAILTLIAGPARAQGEYRVEHIPFPAGSKSFAALSDDGSVVGVSVFVDGWRRGYRFADGVVEPLPFPVESDLGTEPDQLVEGADARGNLYGRCEITPNVWRAVRWGADGIREYAMPGDGAPYRANAVSPGGLFAASAWVFPSGQPGWTGEYGWDEELPFFHGRDPMRMVVWDLAGEARVLTGFPTGMTPNWSGQRVSAINDRGQVVFFQAERHQFAAFLHDPVNGVTRLPTQGMAGAHPTDVDERGRVVGLLHSSSLMRYPVLWEGGRVTHIPLHAAWTSSGDPFINQAGVVVGTGFTPEFEAVPYRWTAAGGTVNLQRAIPSGTGWDLGRVFGVDGRGRVLVQAVRAGREELVLLVPTTNVLAAR